MSTPDEEQHLTAGQRARLAVDTGLAGLVLVVVGTAITANVGGGGEPGLAAYSFGIVFAGLMFVRRRWPLVTLIVTAVALVLYYRLGYPPIGLAAPVAAALYSAAEQGWVRWASGTAAVLLLVSTTVRVLEGDDLAYVLGFEFAGSAGLMAAVVALGDSVRARRLWRAELARQARLAEAELERETARRVEEERLRIARELHDLLAHTVSVISLHTDVARESLRDAPDRAEHSLAAARGACGDATQELRATVGALRAESVGEPVLGLRELDGLLANTEAAGVRVQKNVVGDVTALPAIVDATAYRVMQEALSNVLRHSGANRVDVDIGRDDARLRLRIKDDGRGRISKQGESGWGLIGMHERLALLGGTLHTESPVGGGFSVEAGIPLRGQT